ncbi:hypothetical protein LCGC14_2728170, partial [marine sediment metagenome]
MAKASLFITSPRQREDGSIGQDIILYQNGREVFTFHCESPARARSLVSWLQLLTTDFGMVMDCRSSSGGLC